MPNQTLARGLVLAGIALAFGVGALRLPIGRLSQSGAGLFPLMVSGLLLVLALIMVARSFGSTAPPIHLDVRNIAILLVALGGFVVGSRLINMAMGIVWLVFVATFAGTSYSWQRNLKISAGLIAIAFLFQRFLGLNLRLL